MVNFQEVKDSELLSKIESHEKMGGALRISVYEIKENYLGELPAEYEAHLAVARQALAKESDAFNAQTDFDKLDSSGQKINLHHFFGPHFDLKNKKPVIRGQLGNETLNSYFYYDQPETPANKVDINTLDAEYRLLDPESRGYFIHALTEPPYNMKLGKEIKKRGECVLDFLDYFFGDIDALTIYAWNTSCSTVFDAGEEWWGSYFWTVYNPTKNWYIGIIASETD